ncbi:hypothetical protein [Paraburkholderia mimosarum]|uniref:hypothetical protein n=1 Tax=Paraburkholderia mimosarum TaxID=312026 RepID=UPI00041CFBBF|nr:hypothetical protein [Paraburkholderia mimosarum]
MKLDALNRALPDTLSHRAHLASDDHTRDRHRLMLLAQIPDQSFALRCVFMDPGSAE